MFRAYDKKSAIKEIQRFVYKLSDYYESIPRISIDGIYGAETRNAVTKYQEHFNLPADGIVNNKTHESIYSEYLKVMKLESITDAISQNRSFPFRRGNFGNDILYLNLMLSELQKVYKEIGIIRINELYSADTERVVENIRRIYSLRDSKEVDAELFSRMENEINIRRKFN